MELFSVFRVGLFFFIRKVCPYKESVFRVGLFFLVSNVNKSQFASANKEKCHCFCMHYIPFIF